MGLPAGGGTGSEVVSTGSSTLTTNYNIYALKTTGTLTSDGVADRILSIGSGGLILGGDIGANGASYQANLNFGAAEGIFYNTTTAKIYGKISGSNGLTIASAVNAGTIYLMNTNNDFTGRITINPCGAWAVFDSATGLGSLGASSNSLYFNGGMIYRNSNDRLLPSRTLTLGPLGGRIFANGANTIILGQITGPGNLTVVKSTVILANDTMQGQSANNYAGGTRVLFNGVLVVSNNVSMGSGDLVIEPGGSATLMGNTNLAATARAHVPCLATLALAAPAPTFGNITGGGSIVLGQGTTPKNDTTLTIGGDNSSSAFYGLISEVSSTAGSGKGSLIKSGTGTLSLSGTQTFTGPTIVSNGTLRLLGAVAGNLNIAPGATLSGYGAVGGSLTNSGTWLFNLSSASAFDSFTVNGNVNVAGATLVLGGSYVPKSNVTLPIIQAGSISGTFANVPLGYWVRTSGGTVNLTRASGMSVMFR